MREAAQEREENLSPYDHVNVHHRVNGLNLRTYRFLNFLSATAVSTMSSMNCATGTLTIF